MEKREMAVLMYVASLQVYQRAALCILQPSEVSDLRGPLPSKETSERIHEICSATEADHGQTEPRYALSHCRLVSLNEQTCKHSDRKRFEPRVYESS